jgi:hypothetical protein
MILQSYVVDNQWKNTEVVTINKNNCLNSRLSMYNYMNIKIKFVPVCVVNW